MNIGSIILSRHWDFYAFEHLKCVHIIVLNKQRFNSEKYSFQTNVYSISLRGLHYFIQWPCFPTCTKYFPISMFAYYCFYYFITPSVMNKTAVCSCYTRRNARFVTSLQQYCYNVVPSSRYQVVFALVVERLLWQACNKLLTVLRRAVGTRP